MEAYRIVLPNEKIRTYNIISGFILLLNMLAFTYIFFNAADSKIKYITLFGMLIGILSLVIGLLNSYKKFFTSYRAGISFIIMAVLWLLAGKYLLTLFLTCFAVIGFYAARKFEVIFSAEKITYPSFPVKTFLWNDVSNVILKDGLLTIDLKNNTLIQAIITKESADAISDKVFNDFCAQKLNP